jgi:hypothetical protein
MMTVAKRLGLAAMTAPIGVALAQTAIEDLEIVGAQRQRDGLSARCHRTRP